MRGQSVPWSRLTCSVQAQATCLELLCNKLYCHDLLNFSSRHAIFRGFEAGVNLVRNAQILEAGPSRCRSRSTLPDQARTHYCHVFSLGRLCCGASFWSCSLKRLAEHMQKESNDLRETLASFAYAADTSRSNLHRPEEAVLGSSECSWQSSHVGAMHQAGRSCLRT